MTYAFIQNDTITHVGPLPSIWWDGDRWRDFRDDDGTYAASLGWLPITYQPRPDDTDTTTWERDEPALVDGLPVVGWTERLWTEAELAAEAEQDARLDDLADRVARIEAKLWPADLDPEPDAPIDAPTWSDYGGIWPNGQLLSDGGTTWRNVSGVPLTTPPSGFPGHPSQWIHLFVEVITADPDTGQPDWPAWDSTITYRRSADQVVKVTHKGHLWKLVHDNAVAGWEPGGAGMHGVWADEGPIA